MSKLVSMIVLSYNNAKFIKKTISSVIDQSYENIEIIVIDDGSTDESVKVLNNLKNEFNFQLFTKENGGVVSAINFGIERVNGYYTILHACDDISLPDRVAQQVEVFSRFPDASFVSSNVNLVNKDGIYKKELLKRSQPKIISIDDALLGADITSVGCIYRTELLKKFTLDEKYIAEDPQIHFRLLKEYSYAVVEYGEPVLNYYLNAGGQMGTKLKELLLQNMHLLTKYKNNNNFKKAYERVQVCYLSYLCENNKKQAINYLFKNINLVTSMGFNRVFIKFFLPYKWHRFFKNNRS